MRPALTIVATVVVVGVLLAACGGNDDTDTDAGPGDPVADDRTTAPGVELTITVEGTDAMVTVTAPDDTDIAVAPVLVATRSVDGDTVVHRRLISGGEGQAEAPSATAIAVRAGETHTFDGPAGVGDGIRQVCVEAFSTRLDPDRATGDEITVDAQPGNEFACAPIGDDDA